jgi:hypothetical protein
MVVRMVSIEFFSERTSLQARKIGEREIEGESGRRAENKWRRQVVTWSEGIISPPPPPRIAGGHFKHCGPLQQAGAVQESPPIKGGPREIILHLETT